MNDQAITKTYKPGQSLRFTIRQTVLGVLIDPTTTVLTIHPPSGANIVPAVVRDSVGVYHADYALLINAPPGPWVYRWQTTGTPTALNGLRERSFLVAPLDF